MNAIEVDGLTKAYRIRIKRSGFAFGRREVRTVEALRGVSFSVAEGELIGYIGPNGAGKSTTVKALTGILVPDAGECRVLGLVPWRERVRLAGRIGVVFGQRSQLWWDLPVTDSFTLLRDMYRVGREDYRRALDDLTDRLALAPLLASPVRQLSLGQRMRCELAASLLHGPRVLFLDEPTIGLDAVSKLAVREFIRTRNRETGMTVVLTTHDMDDLAALCTRVLLVGHGEILRDGTVRDLLDDAHERRLRAALERPLDPALLPAGVRVASSDATGLTLSFDPAKTPAAALIALLNDACGIRDVTVENPPIDEVVARRYAEMDGGAR